MFRIPVCMVLTIAFSFGQQNRKPDFESLLDAYKDTDPDGLLPRTIAVFSLPPEQTAKRNAMLTRLSHEGEFPRWAALVTEWLRRQPENGATILDFHESIVRWLEQSSPQDLKDANLTWVTSNTLRFFEENGNSRLPDLFKGNWREEVARWETNEKGCLELAERKYRVARRLAVILLRFPSTAEEGFRLLSAAGGMEMTTEKMDAAARIALAATSDRVISFHAGDPFFRLRYKGGGSGSESLDRHSSVRWLSDRLAVERSEEVIPPAWLASMAETDPGRAEMVAALWEPCRSAELDRLWTPERVKTDNLGPVTAMLFREIFTFSTARPGTESFFAEKLSLAASLPLLNEHADNDPISLLIRGALLAAATSDEAERETLCRLVGKILFGRLNRVSGEFSMVRALMDWPLDDRAASLRLLATLHRLRIPAGSSVHAVTPMFRDKPPLTFDETEAILESAGWLQDAPQWNPPRVTTCHLGPGPNNTKRMIAGEVLLSRVLVDQPGFDSHRFAARLKERKKGRFGALLFASQFMQPNERDELILSAFSGMEDEWTGNATAKMPPFSLVTGMMTPESAAKLPAFLRPAP
jgi:hypothetical protein